MKNIVWICLIFSISCLHAQDQDAYARLSDQVDEAQTSQDKIHYARIWLDKARAEQQYAQQVASIREIMFASPKSQLPIYADTLLSAAQNSRDPSLIGKAFLTKGIIAYDRNQLSSALDAYLKANEYLIASGTDYDRFKLKTGIANTKYHLGYYHEAISLFKECLAHFQNRDSRAYLNTLYSLGLCYNRIGDYQQCAYFNSLGAAFENQSGNQKMHYYFLYSSGINDYFLKDYSSALAKLGKAAVHLQSLDDIANASVAWFYLGKTHLAQNNFKKALPYLEKVDSTFQYRQYIRPDLRQTYDILITHYHNKKDQEKELYYVRRLIEVENVLNKDYRFLSQRINKEYDLKQLQDTNHRISRNLQLQNWYWGSGFVAALFVVSWLLLKYLRLKRYHRNYLKLMADPAKKAPSAHSSQLLNLSPSPSKKDENQPLPDSEKQEKDLSPKLITEALTRLDRFEQNHGYLKTHMDLHALAEILRTNQKYTSWIINRYRNKGILEYLRDLRLDYIVEKLKTDHRLRNYTDQALAEECGFGSTQSFTRSFNAAFGMPPRYFIRKLNKGPKDPDDNL